MGRIGEPIPRQEEIDAMLADGASTGAIAAHLGVAHSDVVRARKNRNQRLRAAQNRIEGKRYVAPPEVRERIRAHNREASRRRTDERHAKRAEVLAEESLYRKTARMRRLRTIEMLAEGKTSAEIARALDVGQSTINQIIAALQERRNWRRQASVTVLTGHETLARIRKHISRGEVSGWVLGLIVAELDRLDAENQDAS